MKETKTIYQKLAFARVELQKRELKKSGENKFAKFKYFELGDFLPTVNEIFKELGLVSVFNMYKDIATMTIIDVESEKELLFTTPIADIGQNKMAPIQQLGSQHTYLKRYLFLNALEIVEGDVINALDNTQKEVIKTEKIVVDKPKKVEKTPEQIERENITNSIKKIVADKNISPDKVLEINKGKKLSAMSNIELLDSLMTFESLEV